MTAFVFPSLHQRPPWVQCVLCILGGLIGTLWGSVLYTAAHPLADVDRFALGVWVITAYLCVIGVVVMRDHVAPGFHLLPTDSAVHLERSDAPTETVEVIGVSDRPRSGWFDPEFWGTTQHHGTAVIDLDRVL